MYHRFLDPTTDVAFKKVFGDKNKTDILISFLNNILERTSGNRIIEIAIMDPHNHPETILSKNSVVDIKCKDEQNITYIIEMQVINEYRYLDRAQYYTCLEVSRQLNKGEFYSKLTPVIFIGIANFKLFENADFINHHKVLNTKTYKNELTLTEYHFLELPKFNKKITELLTIMDQWAYFLKNASDIEQVPAQFNANKEIVEGFEILRISNFTNAELEQYDAEVDALRLEAGRQEQRAKEHEQRVKDQEQRVKDQEQRVKDQEQRVKDKEEIEKLKAAVIKAKLAGAIESKMETKEEIAKNLLNIGMNSDDISKTTGLTIDVIEKLQKNSKT